MAVLAYRSWGFIPIDTDPSSQAPLSYRPPMLTAMAIDGGSSLVFELAAHQGDIEVRLETTALSAEGRGPDIAEVYSGSANGYRPCSEHQWEKTVEGINGVFTCRLSGVGSHVKFHSRSADNLIVTSVRFGTP